MRWYENTDHEASMNRRSRILLIMAVAMLAIAVVSLGISDQSKSQTTIDTEASQNELLTDALRQPHSTNYKVTHFSKEANGKRQKITTRKVDNENDQFVLRLHSDVEGRTYGTPVSQWSTHEKTDGWELRMTAERRINYFSPVPEVPAGTVQIVQKNKSNIILQVDNAKVIASIISFTPLATTSDTTESRLRVYIDGENNRLDKVVYYTREENGDEYYSTLNYSNYGNTTVERPESIPFSLHERIRLLLYKLGLI